MWKSIAAAFALCIAGAGCSPGVQAGSAPSAGSPAPEFAGIERWLNSEPLTMHGLKGKVVLVEFWTYSCINCIHVMPHVNQWHQRYRDQGLVVVGVHTPEYDEEHDAGRLRDAMKRYGVEYAVAQDNDYRTWNAWGNRFWPALYLVDRDGRVVYRHVGEGDYDVTEARIRELLAGS
ncbi:MAG TPA: thioredoxin family protein [Lysobacter sp.]